jgi:hypothetical protein
MQMDAANSYVYLISRSDGTPCYVGKGKRRRMHEHAKHTANRHLARIYAKADGVLPVRKIDEKLTGALATELEVFLIKEIGREKNGGPLVNLTDGGDGTHGRIVAQESRKKSSISHTGRRLSLETRLNMSQSGKGRKLTTEHKRKIGDAHRGKFVSPSARRHASEGQKRISAQTASRVREWHASMTPEQKAARAAKISAAVRIAMAKPKVRVKIGDALSGLTHDEARRAITRETLARSRIEHPERWIKQNAALERIHQGNIGRHHSEKTKAKMRASHAKRLGAV